MMDAIRARMRESAIADEEKALDQLVDIAGLTLGEREAICGPCSSHDPGCARWCQPRNDGRVSW